MTGIKNRPPDLYLYENRKMENVILKIILYNLYA